MTDWRSSYPFASHYFQLGAHRIHYVDEGPRDAPPLLLLHGNPTWSFYWRHVITALRGEFRVVAPDHLGCGLSDKPQRGTYRLADHVSNLERLVAHLGLDAVNLGVHDWGGAIGMGFATRNPERVARLIVFNSAAFRSTRLPLRIACCRIPWLGPLAVRGLNAFARAATVMATGPGLDAETEAGLLAPYDSWAHRAAIQRFVEDIPMHPGHPSWPTLVAIEEALPRLRERPMLILWGERDFCFTPWFREEWQRRFPTAEVHAFADAGHYVVLDEHARVIELMRGFLSR